jgi:outer membrane receptor protein involved in Fe transport
VGNFNLLGDVTYVATDDETLGNGQVIHGAGNWDLNTSGLEGTFPHWRGLAGLNWSLSGFGAGVIGHYIGGFKECGDGGGNGTYSGSGLCYQNSFFQRAVSPYAAADLFLSYRFLTGMGKTTAMVGMNNVFDASPPFIANAFEANTDPTGGYDIVGRFVYARLSHTF